MPLPYRYTAWPEQPLAAPGSSDKAPARLLLPLSNRQCAGAPAVPNLSGYLSPSGRSPSIRKPFKIAETRRRAQIDFNARTTCCHAVFLIDPVKVTITQR